MMATVYINNQLVDIGNEKLNLIQAALKIDVFIPYYCWHPALTVVASCRMCLVEIGERKPDGSTVMQPRVVPACQTMAREGMVVHGNSAKASYAQAQTLEYLLINHPLDCPVCDKAGECPLQDYSYDFGNQESRLIDPKNTPPNKPYIGDNITLFTDRCIQCSRCVRFTREISGTAELQFIRRGDHQEIDIFPGQPLNNKLATNVVDLCPVGALCSKDFLYTQRVWYMRTHKSVCSDCSTGCSIHIDGNKNIVYRLRHNPEGDGEMNRRRCARLKRLSDYLHGSDRLFLLELLVLAEPAQLEQFGGDKGAYDRELRPALTVRTLHELQEAGVEPDVWKVEGMDRREDCASVVAAARRDSRDQVSCIVLGRGEDEWKVREWLAAAAGVPGFIGFAVGRTTFCDPLVNWRANRISRQEAVAEIARRYREWVNIFVRECRE